ncbi:unnamed protein product [Boreogadus saida]
MNVIILSRSKDKLERTAKEIEEETGKRVKVLVADFSRDDVYREIEDNLKDLEIGVLVARLFSFAPLHTPRTL